MFDVEEHVDGIIERFLQDINECVVAVNKALPHYGKELEILYINPQQGKIDVHVNDVRVIH